MLDKDFATLDRPVVVANLETSESALARSVCRLLQAERLDRPLLDGLAWAAVERTIEDCDDETMAILLGRLRQIISLNKDSKEGENRAAVRQALENALAGVDEVRLLANLEAEPSPHTLALAAMLRGQWRWENAELDALIECGTGKSVRQCSPYDIGGLLTQLNAWVEQHGREKPTPEALHRERLAEFLSALQHKHDCERLLAEWRRTGGEVQAAALSAVLSHADDAALDGLTRAFADKPVVDCTADDLQSIEHAIVSQFNRLAMASRHRERLGQSVAAALSEVPDRAILRQNLSGDGQPLALALLPLLDATPPFNPDDVDALVLEGLKKPSGHCETAEIDPLARRIEGLVRKHREDRDPRRQLAEDFRAVVAKHKTLVGQERLLEVLQNLVKELQLGQL